MLLFASMVVMAFVAIATAAGDKESSRPARQLFTTLTGARDEQPSRTARQFNFKGIVGGEEAEDGEFPSYAIPAFGFTSCGGILIHPDVILSAAHCQGAWADAGSVYIGANTVDGTDATEEIVVVSEHNHPDYVESTFANDIALIKLETNSAVTPATWNSDPSVPVDDDPVTVCGFGTTSFGGEPSDALLKVTVNAVNSDVCVAQYSGEVAPDVMLCAAASGKDACQGDS